METNRQTCFVIMPFSKTTDEHTEEYWTKHFDDIIKPIIEENPGLEARRSEPLRGDILRQIITDLVVSPIVVADLTDKNANVLWELGVRQSFKHGTITIVEGKLELPFDISVKGTLDYNTKDHFKMAEFRKQLKKALNDCLSFPDRPDSQVLETLSGRGTLFEIFRRDEAIRRLDAVLSECNRNLIVLETLVKRVRANQQDKKNRRVSADRFRIIGIELLITNRYADEDKPFFELAEKCWSRLFGINEQLSSWNKSSEITEKYILKINEETKNIIEDFKAKVELARDKLSKRF